MGEKVVLREQVKELFNKKYGKSVTLGYVFVFLCAGNFCTHFLLDFIIMSRASYFTHGLLFLSM